MKKWMLVSALAVILTACAPSQVQKNPPLPSTKGKEMVLPKVDHVVIVVEENRSQQEITDNPSAPFINSLMKQGANLTNYHGIEHPSQPNYLDLFSGSNKGITSDGVPEATFAEENLATELFAKKYTFTGFSEDLPSTGYNGASFGKSGYARKHNPWINFSNIPMKANQPFTHFPADFNQLPTVSFVIPSLQNDMHDGSIKVADEWLKKNLNPYIQWAKSHNSLFIVTWDEDDRSQDNRVPAFFVGPMIKSGQYNKETNHFGLLRTIEDLYGLSHAGAARTSESIADIWK